MITENIQRDQQQPVYTGLTDSDRTYRNLPPVTLMEMTILKRQGTLTVDGALAIDTGQFKGRAPLDRFIVKDEITEDQVWWNDQHNFPVDSKVFDRLYHKLQRYLADREKFVRDVMVCADSRYRQPIRVISQYPWSDLFVHNMFIQPSEAELENFVPDWQVICVPGFLADPKNDGMTHTNFTILNFKRKTIIIGGTGFTGEIKKSVFSVLNFILPLQHNILPMHCAANIGKNNDTALFFGLSGTGKTTLSSIHDRMLIGDDEHGWSDTTIFNFEGGCYARTINLTREREPEIYGAIRFGALLENTGFKPDGVTPDYFCDKKTPNTRVSYPLHYAGSIAPCAVGTIPRNIFFLTCDAFGVLPPVSKLTNEQALYYFISGYSAKIPGSEVGVTTPTAVFSYCFGAPFLPLHPMRYAQLLNKKLQAGNITTWLINTGWLGGPFGVGKRIKLEYSRSIIKAILEGALDKLTFNADNIFELAVPAYCPGVPVEILDPSANWQDKNEYGKKATELIAQFQLNMAKYQ